MDELGHYGEYFTEIRRMNQETRKVILFWDNATCHLETAQASLKNIKLVFLPKNTTSRLKPLDAGIMSNFKHKYRKLLKEKQLLK